MNRVMIDSSAETPRVIVVERRSLFSQIGGVWFVALPIIAAYVICRVPYDVPEASFAELHMGDNSWQFPGAPKIDAGNPAEVSKTAAAPAIADTARPVVVQTARTTTLAAETVPPSDPPKPVNDPPADAPANGLPQGVVVLDMPRAGANPVAVFDPEGKATAEKSEPEPTEPANRTLEAALKFDGGQPTTDETRQALAEINAAAEKARVERERAESLKPLVEVHEKHQAEVREVRRADAERRRIALSREAFLQGIGTVLASDASIPQQGRQIDLMVRREIDAIDFAPFDSIFKRLVNMRASRAGKLRYLIRENVPEALVLSYLIELDSKEIGKSGGPRDKDHAIVRSAEFLMTNVKGH